MGWALLPLLRCGFGVNYIQSLQPGAPLMLLSGTSVLGLNLDLSCGLWSLGPGSASAAKGFVVTASWACAYGSLFAIGPWTWAWVCSGSALGAEL